LTHETVDMLASIAELVAVLCVQAGEQILSDDRLLDRMGASEQERNLWGVDPGYPGFSATSRLDSFMGDDGPRFVEYNAESPASIGFCDCLSQIFLELPAVSGWDHAGGLTRYETRRALLDVLLWAYSEWGGTDTPAIAIIDWDTVITKRDFELCADYFRGQGIPTVICDPRQLRYEGGSVWLEDRRITLAYRRVLLHELLERGDEVQPLLTAYREGAICMVNSPRSKLLHKKALFALLSDPEAGIDMTAEQRALVDRVIPWTRCVVAGETTYDGQRRDILELAVAERETMALKPSDEYGGKGVVLGWESSEEPWRAALETAMQGHYVLQERVPVPHSDFPVWIDGRLEFVPLLVDADPLLFRNRLGGILTRVSGSALLNVSAGTGSTTPTFVAE